GLHGVLQAAGLHAGPAPGAHGRTRPASIVQGTVAASGVSRVDLRAWVWPGVRRAGLPRLSGGADAGPGVAVRRRLSRNRLAAGRPPIGRRTIRADVDI